MVTLNYRDSRPIYSQIIDSYREQILTGVLREGDRLPSVRELAMELTINPNTIQRAYRELEGSGWIASVPGKGSFVCGVPQNQSTQRLLSEFDRLTKALTDSGVSRETLIARIMEGGNSHA